MSKRELSEFTKKAIDMAREIRAYPNQSMRTDDLLPDDGYPSSERTYDVTLSEEHWDILLKLLHQQIKICNKNARMTSSGYGKATSYAKAEEWEKKAKELKLIIQRISDKAI